MGKRDFDSPMDSMVMLNRNKIIRKIILNRMQNHKDQAVHRYRSEYYLIIKHKFNIGEYLENSKQSKSILLTRVFKNRIKANNSFSKYTTFDQPRIPSKKLNLPRSISGKQKLKIDGILKQIDNQTLTCTVIKLHLKQDERPLSRHSGTCNISDGDAYMFGGQSITIYLISHSRYVKPPPS